MIISRVKLRSDLKILIWDDNGNPCNIPKILFSSGVSKNLNFMYEFTFYICLFKLLNKTFITFGYQFFFSYSITNIYFYYNARYMKIKIWHETCM